MCGIAGILDPERESEVGSVLARMTQRLAHRGPDGAGHFVAGPLGLGHRRLAIIDPSPAGSQPMSNDEADVVLTFNGEIYNFAELRRELRHSGYRFRSQSDTEVLLRAYEEWGTDVLHHLNGMFAFAIWDARRRQLFLARDRHGVKPLYYLQRGSLLLFASEIKALLAHPAVSVDVCPEALGEYFTFQNIFSDRTLFAGVRLLPPGSSLTIDVDQARAVERKWWDLTPANQPFSGSLREAADELYRLFDRAVTRQLVADAPVGAYLSGGIDSGSITGIAARGLGRLHTFTGGFDLSSVAGLELGFDERPAAEVMANHFKTEHYEVVLHAGDMEYVLPELIHHLEDLRVGQCYPNYYVARLASKFVKVVLSGTGGDELFAGYPWRYFRSPPGADPRNYYQSCYDYWQRLVPDQDRSRFFAPSLRRAIENHPPREVFGNVFDGWQGPLDSMEQRIEASLYFELKTFLHGLLVVEDKLSMAHGLESRVPFLDHELVDFAMSLPPRFKLHNLQQAPQVDEDEPAKKLRYGSTPTADGKVVLREAMRHMIPDSVVGRAKQGFSAPDATWFRGESIAYVNHTLRQPRALLWEFLQPAYVHQVLDEHNSGRRNHRLLIWSLLSFEWWLKQFVEDQSVSRAA